MKVLEAVALRVGDAIATGEAVPAPRPLDVLLNDAEVRTALDARGTLVEVPMLIEDGRPVKADIALDAGLLAESLPPNLRLSSVRNATMPALRRVARGCIAALHRSENPGGTRRAVG